LRPMAADPAPDPSAEAVPRDALCRVAWTPVRAPVADAPDWVVLDGDAVLPGGERYPDLAALRAAVEAGRAGPEVVVTAAG
ncbi:hypothetical protein, partial [Streptomyces sp. GSL17-113]|uniref:hypothetical protein n=1 Tax=Streptomyces sp. GSL17-113 TaxID=3115365 RepID=UPI002E799C84